MVLKDKPKHNWKNRHFVQSFKFAVIGLLTAYKEERNVRFHVASIILVVMLGAFLHVSVSEWLWLILAIFAVLSSEIWNSAIENVVDLATNYERNPLAKKAKDMAAGAVLLAAIFALLIGTVIFLPKIWVLFFN
ncbi:diacylglycerol kinase family protein [Ligilactobacillus sp. WILCCON 0076]|uniref:Diacylglycerol kinase family protein n=1 Tax=Ligilactobacillus ubinensis TaxID=2876789 RepID=A0A9X2FHB2_9LACO|nr:diacylglycerol kinase family protein [Ligilactobacillus ubinensis]MCP0886189.1 diacylglycerol kinase family protein [Ligilactobacillus ubinensis]